VRPHQVKEIILTNAIELDLPNTVKIHPVVNVSRVRRYKDQVEGQKKERLIPVIIKEECQILCRAGMERPRVEQSYSRVEGF